MGFSNGTPTITTDGLVFAVDAGNGQSYVSGSLDTFSLVSSNTGSIHNDVDFNSANQGSWEFDGADDKIDFDMGGALDELVTATFSMWLNQAAIDTYDVIISKGDASPNVYFWIYVWTTGNGYLYFGIDNDTNVGDGQVTNYSSLVNAGEWFHLAVVYNGAGATDADKIKIFINGDDTSCSHGGTIPTTLPTTTSKILRMGGSSWGSFYGDNGQISSVQIYNKSLSSSEVLQNYNATKERFI